MSEYYLGELRIFPFNFAPKTWAMCNGQLLSIAQNQALFSLLGTTYGGNGVNNFALPDLRTRAAAHVGGGLVLGQPIGTATHTLNITEMPQHTHIMRVDTSVVATSNVATATSSTVLGNSIGKTSSATPVFNAYNTTLTNPTTLNPSALNPVGGNQPHENRQPYLALTICIALAGIFPSRN